MNLSIDLVTRHPRRELYFRSVRLTGELTIGRASQPSAACHAAATLFCQTLFRTLPQSRNAYQPDRHRVCQRANTRPGNTGFPGGRRRTGRGALAQALRFAWSKSTAHLVRLPNKSFKGNNNRTDYRPLNSGVRPKCKFVVAVSLWLSVSPCRF